MARSEYYKKWYAENRVRISEERKQWRLDNPGLSRALKRASYVRNRTHVRAQQKAARDANRELTRRNAVIYYRQNRERINFLRKKFYEKNKERLAADCRRRRQAGLIKVNKARKLFMARERRKKNPESFRLKYMLRMANDINFRLSRRLRTRVRLAVRKGYKSASTMALIGCSIDQLRLHLQSQFASGMQWNNMGLWHIDHILPCASFDLTKPEHQKACFHWSNLQPLWAADNIRKGAKVSDRKGGLVLLRELP